MGQSCPEPEDYFDDKYMKLTHPVITDVDCTREPKEIPKGDPTDIIDDIFGQEPAKTPCSNYQNQGPNSTENYPKYY